MNLHSYSLPQLKQLSVRIAKEIAKRDTAGKASMLKKLQQMAREHGLTLGEVLGNAGSARSKGVKVSKASPPSKAPLPAKYRHPSNQDLAWSGRGRRPHWVDAWLANGGALDALAITAQKFEKKQQRKTIDALRSAPAEAATEDETTQQG